jgi:hypothetical protein
MAQMSVAYHAAEAYLRPTHMNRFLFASLTEAAALSSPESFLLPPRTFFFPDGRFDFSRWTPVERVMDIFNANHYVYTQNVNSETIKI